VRKEYLFGVDDDDFDEDVHVVTGLLDEHEWPICRRQTPCGPPIGFGRDKEWKDFERTTVTSTNLSESSGQRTRRSLAETFSGSFGRTKV
jgi:hypothetical protein